MSAPILREIFIDPINESRAAGMCVGDVIFVPFLVAKADGSVEASERTRIQIGDVLTTMDRVLDIAGATRHDVARVTFYMRDVYERPILNEIWRAWFPDPEDRPPHKYVPASLPDGVNVAIQVLGIVGADREVLEIPGVEHGDPMAMGARVANLVTSSRLFGTQADLEEEITLVLDRVGIIMEQAGGVADEITQATLFVGSTEIAAVLIERWNAHWEGRAHRPRTHLIVTDLGGGNGFPRIEILGVLGRASV